MTGRNRHTAPAVALLLASLIPGAGAVTSSQTVQLSVTFTAPPCTVDINGGTGGTVALGALPVGSKTHTPFTLTVTCGTDRPSSLYATVQTGGVSGTTVNMVNGAEGGTPVALTLNTGTPAAAVQYGTDGATNSAKQFCAGNTTRTCTFTPVTGVSPGTNGGAKTAAVVFTMVNP